jgi:hypothetical protein
MSWRSDLRVRAFWGLAVLVLAACGAPAPGGGDVTGADSAPVDGTAPGPETVLPDGGPDTAPGDAAPDPDVADVLPELPADADGVECETGTRACLDDVTTMLCQGGAWVVAQTCAETQLCLDGVCATAEACEPGVISGCWSLTARRICHASGLGWVPLPCVEGELCVDGKCGVLACTPGSKECASPDATQACLPDGSGWGEPVPCGPGEACMGGECLNGCAGDIKYNQSNVGCEFWSLDLGQWDVKEGESMMEPPASPIPHAVIVGNPNAVAVDVTFEVGDGTPVEIADPVVPPGETRAFLMPVLSLQLTGVTSKSIRLLTNHPVTAAQFNPPNNEDFVHTSDASLLYPISILGTEHYAVSTASHLGPTVPMLGKMPSTWGYLAVVAVEPGTTTVTIGPLTVDTEAGDGVDAHLAGESFDVELAQWEVLNLQSVAGSMFVEGNHLTGTRIQATGKVAAFAGHDCEVIGDSNCDHLETQLLPVQAWGTEVVAGRMDTPSANQYRVVSGADGNAISTDPSIPGLDGEVLEHGDWRHVESHLSFRIQGTGPLQLVQFIAGNDSGGSVLVDPSMTAVVPVIQYRKDYPILVPTAYAQNRINVVREADSPIYVDGQPVSAGFQGVPGTGWQVGNVPVTEGVHQITGDAPFGLIAYGYANKVSYAYPGGLNGIVTE